MSIVRNADFEVSGICKCSPKEQQLAIVYPYTCYICMNCKGKKK